MRQLPLAITPPAEAGFDALLVGANAQVVQHLRALTLSAAPVYLWGPSGCGKTHLLRALAAQHQAQGLRVGSFGPAQAPPWTYDEGWSLVILDDCDTLDRDRQQAAFATFVEAASHGAQWVAAGRVPPVDLPVRDDLRTRLAWGHVFAVQALGEGETRSVLRREADRRGIFLSDEVMAYLLTRFQRDLKTLMQMLDRLDEFALAEHRMVTVPLLRKMLAEQPGSAPGEANAPARPGAGTR
jgi:DnaA family protein